MEQAKPVILVIDDDDSVRASLKLLLKDTYNVVEANSFAQAHEVIQLLTPDLVTLDVRLSDGNGLDILGEIRQKGLDCPVVIISGYPCLGDACMALRLKAVDYIQKPFSPEKVRLVIEENLIKQGWIRTSSKSLIPGFHVNANLIALGKASAAFVHDIASPIQGLQTYTNFLKGQIQAMSSNSIVDTTDEMIRLLSWCSQLIWEWNTLVMPVSSYIQKYQVDAMMERIKAIVKSKADELDVQITYLYEEDVDIYGDRLLIERAWINLLFNAIAASSSGGKKVSFEFKNTAFGSECIIEDSGNEDAAQIIRESLSSDPFDDHTHSRRGLGLFIVSWIMERHEGNIEVIHNFGIGTKVKLIFPFNHGSDEMPLTE